MWGELENHIAKQTGFLQNRVTVLSGPILSSNDPPKDFGFGTDIQVPIEFWKVVVAVEAPDTNPRLRAYGFILSQQEAIDEHGWENRFRAGKFKEQQVSLGTVTEKTGVTFADALLAADPIAADPNESRGRLLRAIGDVRLR